MRSVSIAGALDGLLTKVAQIATSPRTFFVHVRVPEHVAEDLRTVQKRVIPDASKHEDIDHITLVYTHKPPDDHAPDKVHRALAGLREIGDRTEPIEAKLQGWGFFDGASSGGKPSTALVALVDAPGLEHLHVDMSRKLKDLGIEPSDLHVFTPHITLGYLGHHGRVDGDLPPLSGKFTIDRAHVASRDHHEIPLTGGMSLGEKAAMDAISPQALEYGAHEETQEHHLDPMTTLKIVRDHLEKEPDYYKKREKKSELDSMRALTESTYATHGPEGVMRMIGANPQLRSPMLTNVKTLAGAASPRPQHGLFSGVMQTQATPLRQAVSGKIGALGEAAAKFAVDYSPSTNFSMSPSALRTHRRDAPGKGETSPVVGMATPQTGAMHSGGGFK